MPVLRIAVARADVDGAAEAVRRAGGTGAALVVLDGIVIGSRAGLLALARTLEPALPVVVGFHDDVIGGPRCVAVLFGGAMAARQAPSGDRVLVRVGGADVALAEGEPPAGPLEAGLLVLLRDREAQLHRPADGPGSAVDGVLAPDGRTGPSHEDDGLRLFEVDVAPADPGPADLATRVLLP